MFKVLTLNMHSYFEPRTYWAFYNIARDISDNRYDAVCLQEVNQLRHTGIVSGEIRTDNAAYIVKLILEKEFDVHYDLFWERVKILDGLIEEGVAILTPHRIIKKESMYVSTITDIRNWRCRKNLYACIRKDNVDFDVFSVHFAWEFDGAERFEIQFARFLQWIKGKDSNMIVAGDFNTDYKDRDSRL
ncbi:MAG TPA: endonuclease/exonuclease/phosphatase family protein, partial [Clostridia bacterium]|nr:endonuclease/exonuclease/phosphatase family protein [Clostridia bacterium]